MRTGHKRQLAGGILGLLAGFGLVLRACLTGQWRVSLTAQPPDKRRNAQHENLL